MTNTSPFEIADYLDTPEDMLDYLELAMGNENPNVFIAALGHVAKARGMSEVAELSGLGRESLYKALKSGSKLRYETVQKVVQALGFRLSLEKSDAA
ncbi:putative addiction module antidote protein [Neorhizobium huautlense]|uniref:Addiction module antidote protein n=1 Tax=Neorhizobium huautlense TaxID=67774 RepID=A0ABT9PV93_9HYPH|nr:addiction module antidote protein [Neorhizobium huautlense]MDP9837639.1 putative addiction module antidote protein [Neorhizobium huautlense]